MSTIRNITVEMTNMWGNHAWWWLESCGLDRHWSIYWCAHVRENVCQTMRACPVCGKIGRAISGCHIATKI